MAQRKTAKKTVTTKTIPNFRSNSQRTGVDRASMLFGSRRVAFVIVALVGVSLMGGAAILQKANDSKAATTQRIVLSDTDCTRTINPGTAVSLDVKNSEILCLNPGDYTLSPKIHSIASVGATITTTPSKLVTGKAKVFGKFNVNGDNNRILNLYIDGMGENSGTILTPNGTDNTLIQGNEITSTAPDKKTTDQLKRQGICLNIGTGGGNLSSAGPKNTVIDRNKIFNCGWGKFDQAIYLSNNQNAIVTNNYVYDNPMFGLQFYPDSDGALVENNVFDRNAAGITFSGNGATQKSDNNILRNNTISNSGYNPYGVASQAASSEANIGHWWGGNSPGIGNKADYNCVYNGKYRQYKTDTPVGYTKTGNVDGQNPLYVNEASKDFRLQSGSPCEGKTPIEDNVENPPPPPPSETDTTLPTVSIISPVASTSVSGTSITLSANANDDVAVGGVQFKINNSLVGSEDTSAPYSVTWDSTTVSNGSYSVTAVAKDTSGNIAESSAVTFTVSNVVAPPPPTPSETGQTPYGGLARTIPGTIEVEAFDNGGQNVAYYDTTPGNKGGSTYRSSDVDIANSSGGGQHINWVSKAEWMEYTVNSTSGVYDIAVTAATSDGAVVRLELNGTKLADVSIPKTGGWSTWKVSTAKNISIPVTQNGILRVSFVNAAANLERVSFIPKNVSGIDSIQDKYTFVGVLSRTLGLL